MDWFEGDIGVVYHSYLLRIWQVLTESDHSWRIVLEDVRTGEKKGFSNFDDLLDYLREASRR